MTYITLAPDNQLLVTKSSTIYRGDNMNTSITFLIPTRVNNIDMETATVLLSSIRADGEPDMVILERSAEKYGDSHYKYVLPVTCKLSRYPGRICMWLQFCDGKSCHPTVAKTGECFITIHESKSLDDCLHDHQLTAMYQLKKRLDQMTGDDVTPPDDTGNNDTPPDDTGDGNTPPYDYGDIWEDMPKAITIDPTLSIEGQAADAKVVGEALSGKQPAGNYLTAIPAEYITESELLGKGYLTSYTETDPTVPKWAKEPNKPTYTATEVGAISEDDLQSAVDTALAQAKESGEFDGDDYVLTETDKVEIAEMAAELVDVPDSGGNGDYVGVEPADDDIPKVFITGQIPTTKDDINCFMQYRSKTESFDTYIKIKCQGSSSMSYPKKNFTVKLYSDEARETKLEKNFRDWGLSINKFVLKANWIDHSHARNIVSANLWSEVVESRSDYDTLPEEMRNSPRNGAIDGFPVKVYTNGTYQGIYTWNIGKDAWMWGMDEDNANHVLLCAETNNDGATTNTPCNFRALWSGTDENHWTVEVGTNSTAVKTTLNNLIQFVMDNDGDAFRNGIDNYLDIQSAIDYYIFQYEICGLDGLAKNMLLATYDGTRWICGAYDMDATFGLYWNGSKFVSAQYRCPEDYQETYSLLWKRIEANFMPELKARQAELRKTVLSYANMVTHFERFMDIIGLDLYAEDLTIYTGIPSGSTNNIKQIRNYIRDRQSYVDAEFAAMSAPVPCTGISLNTNTLTFTAEGTQALTATVTPDGCTDPVTWGSDNASVATVNGGVVTAIANGSAVITARCGEYSANCSVAVSGIAEPVPCTGITLDKAELTFVGKGTQTITATVTPADTTDTVVWVSSAPSVVSIVADGNVCTVSGINNGDAIIMATCGDISVECAVSVSGVVSSVLSSSGMFEGASLYDGEVKSGDGTIVTAANCVYSDPVDVSAYAGYWFENAFENVKAIWCRTAFYGENGEYVGQLEGNGFGTIPSNAETCRVSMYSDTANHKATVNIYGDNHFKNDEAVVGAYNTTTGEFNSSDTGSKTVEFDAESYSKWYFTGIWGVFYFDENGNYITYDYTTTSNNGHEVSVVPSGAKRIAACVDLKYLDKAFIRPLVETSHIEKG